MSEYTWGTAAVQGKDSWLVQSSNGNKTSQSAEALSNSGEPVAVKFYQKVNELTFEALIPAGDSSIPAIGDVFTYDGQSYYVTGVTDARQNTGYQRYTLNCRRYLAHNLPANA